MTFLVWDNEQDAIDSLAAVDAVYGCAYQDENGYIMDSWAQVTKSRTEDLWGFDAPEERLGKTRGQLDAALIAGYTSYDTAPDGWFHEED